LTPDVKAASLNAPQQPEKAMEAGRLRKRDLERAAKPQALIVPMDGKHSSGPVDDGGAKGPAALPSRSREGVTL
ncbi:hypothetical protein, partial [Belnapia arida]|uniref:hypothetical protein n=1 Tax=Belnapia arida TaxID=2804533 RepID=UPI001F1B58DA